MAFHLVQLANQMLTMVRQRVSRDLASSVPVCKLAAESVFGVAGDLRDEVGGTQARLVLGRCRTSLGYGPLRPELPAAATVFGAEYVSAAPNPAGWILTEEVTSKKAELLSRL